MAKIIEDAISYIPKLDNNIAINYYLIYKTIYYDNN